MSNRVRDSEVNYDTEARPYKNQLPRSSIISASQISGMNIDNLNLLEESGAASKCKPPPLWMIGLITCGLGFVGVLSAVVFGMGLNQTPVPTTAATVLPTTLPAASQLYIGQSCKRSSQCIPSSYCDSITSVCTCPPSYYYDTTKGVCTARKSYGASCSTTNECEFNQLLLCTGSLCQCDSMMFWNPNTNQCEDKRGLGETCIGVSNECYSSKMVCTTITDSTATRCICPLSTMYFSFFTGDCEYKKTHGTQCFTNAHFECVDYAWCTQWPGDSTYRCTCIPSYYWSGTACMPKKGYLSSCTTDAECIDNQLSLVCVSNKCDCPSNSYWNGTACNFLKPYNGPCVSSTDCLYSTTTCQWVAEQNQYLCVCPTGTYFSLTSNTCVSFKILGSVCTDTSQCPVNSTCLWQSSTSDMRCQCTAGTYYQSGTNSCLFLKSINETCSSSAECQIQSGLFCIGGICTCGSNYYWNSNACQTRKTYNSYSYSQYCTTAAECKTALGLTNCVVGRCVCAYPKTWSSTICA